MKYLIAIVPNAEADAVCDALHEAGVREFILTDVRQYRPERQTCEIYKGVKYAVNTVQCVKLEITVEDASVETTMALIFNSANIDHIHGLSVDLATAITREPFTRSRLMCGRSARPLRAA